MRDWDISPDGSTVWVLTFDPYDTVDGGWGLWVMDRSGTDVRRKSLPSFDGCCVYPEVEIGDRYGDLAYVSVGYDAVEAPGPFKPRHFRFYSVTSDTGLFLLHDTYVLDQAQPDVYVDWGYGEPADLRAVDGTPGFYFRNYNQIFVWNTSSPAKPIRVGWTQDFRWEGMPAARECTLGWPGRRGRALGESLVFKLAPRLSWSGIWSVPCSRSSTLISRGLNPRCTRGSPTTPR